MQTMIKICTALSLVTAFFYLLTGTGVFQAADVDANSDASGIAFAASACYFVGGLLILFKKRWLWTIGAVFNAIVLFIFFSMYIGSNTDIIFSIPGLGTKIPQIILEILLIYLISRYNQTSALLDWVHRRQSK